MGNGKKTFETTFRVREMAKNFLRGNNESGTCCRILEEGKNNK